MGLMRLTLRWVKGGSELRVAWWVNGRHGNMTDSGVVCRGDMTGSGTRL